VESLAVVVLSEIAAFVDLVERASAWLDAALERSRRKRTRTAARILYDAGVLVAGMRTYDNVYRPLLRRMRFLETDASAEERKAILSELEQWNSIHEISPRVHQVVASLEAEREASDTPLDLEPLLQHASKFLQAMELIQDEKRHYSLQLDLQRAVRSAERKEEPESAAHFAERQLHILDLDDLAGADEAFGRLRQRILSEYDLPTPTW
jgi:hypothetical protein